MSTCSKFRAAVESLDCRNPLAAWPDSLLMNQDGDWATYYAPFDHINRTARLVLVGITPGLQQAGNALAALQRELRAGHPEAIALETAKGVASFSGPMRQNLLDMLDFIGLPRVLGLHSAQELFGQRSDLVHYTSVLRYPVTFRGANYGGNPPITRSQYALRELQHWFVDETRLLTDAVYIPLGPAVNNSLDWLVKQGVTPSIRILGGLPHPSPANAERIAYFLNRKAREDLSPKTAPKKIDHARSELLDAVRRLELQPFPAVGTTPPRSSLHPAA